MGRGMGVVFLEGVSKMKWGRGRRGVCQADRDGEEQGKAFQSGRSGREGTEAGWQVWGGLASN